MVAQAPACMHCKRHTVSWWTGAAAPTTRPAQAYEERRRAKDAEREAREAAEEAEAARSEAARLAAEDAEAARWLGQISLDEAGDAGADAQADGPVAARRVREDVLRGELAQMAARARPRA